MDANQLIKALGDAAGAAKPPQEYCFLWIDWSATCMTKSEWSGWMQAVFSVVAILFSGYMVRYELNHQQLMVKKSAVSRIRTFIAFLSSYADRFVGISEFSELEMKRQSALLSEHVFLASSIPAELLDIEWIAALEGARSIAVQFRVLADAVCADVAFGPPSRPIAQQLVAALAEIEKTVRQDHQRVRVWN